MNNIDHYQIVLALYNPLLTNNAQYPSSTDIIPSSNDQYQPLPDGTSSYNPLLTNIARYPSSTDHIPTSYEQYRHYQAGLA